MKTKLFILTICVAFVSLGTSAKTKDTKTLSGNSLTDFGKYTLMISDEPMVINNEEVKTYGLSYENAISPIKVGVVEEEKCKTYIVRSDEFEILYTCNKGVFGVKKMDSKYQTLPKEEMDAKLDRVSYFSQRVICTNNKSEDELLGLIACYFPTLINEEYQANF